MKRPSNVIKVRISPRIKPQADPAAKKPTPSGSHASRRAEPRVGAIVSPGYCAAYTPRRVMNDPMMVRWAKMKRNSSTPPMIMIQAPSTNLEIDQRGDQAEDHAAEQRAGTMPTPPVNSVPPSTTEAMAVSSLPVPASG